MKNKSGKKEMADRLATDLILSPEVSLLCKLGSIAVHTQEMLSPEGHHFDRTVLLQLLNDSEVKDWLKDMDKLALIPKKRG
jgi:hypothetical protein